MGEGVGVGMSVRSGQNGNFSTCANQTSSITVINSTTEQRAEAIWPVICEKFKAISMSLVRLVLVLVLLLLLLSISALMLSFAIGGVNGSSRALALG